MGGSGGSSGGSRGSDIRVDELNAKAAGAGTGSGNSSAGEADLRSGSDLRIAAVDWVDFNSSDGTEVDSDWVRELD